MQSQFNSEAYCCRDTNTANYNEKKKKNERDIARENVYIENL